MDDTKAVCKIFSVSKTSSYSDLGVCSTYPTERRIGSMSELLTMEDDKLIELSITKKNGKSDINKLEGLDNFRGLKILRVSQTHIKKIEGVDHLRTLYELDLSDNEICEMKDLSLPRLRKLNLSVNCLKEFHLSHGLSTIDDIDLSDNEIEKITCSERMGEFFSINLNRNKLMDISFLKDCIGVKVINCQENRFFELPRTKYLRIIQVLDFASNFITKINKDVLDSYYLEVLDLRNNPILYFDSCPESSIDLIFDRTFIFKLDLNNLSKITTPDNYDPSNDSEIVSTKDGYFYHQILKKSKFKYTLI
jgi:hypothetical protein